MKKLNIDAFTMPAFNFNRKFYKQIDYGFTVRSFSVNIIITELKYRIN